MASSTRALPRSLLFLFITIVTVVSLRAKRSRIPQKRSLHMSPVTEAQPPSVTPHVPPPSPARVDVTTTVSKSKEHNGTLVLPRIEGESDEDFVKRFPIDKTEWKKPEFLMIAKEARNADGLIFYPKVNGNVSVRPFKLPAGTTLADAAMPR